MGETYKENVCRAFPKEAVVASLKADSDLFLTHIQNSFWGELSYRLMGILKSNGEVAVKLSDIRSFEELHTNEIHYVQQFKWAPLIRCKDCEHWDTTWQNDYAPNYHYCPMIDGTRRADFYCADAEPKGELTHGITR